MELVVDLRAGVVAQKVGGVMLYEARLRWDVFEMCDGWRP